MPRSKASDHREKRQQEMAAGRIFSELPGELLFVLPPTLVLQHCRNRQCCWRDAIQAKYGEAYQDATAEEKWGAAWWISGTEGPVSREVGQTRNVTMQRPGGPIDAKKRRGHREKCRDDMMQRLARRRGRQRGRKWRDWPQRESRRGSQMRCIEADGERGGEANNTGDKWRDRQQRQGEQPRSTHEVRPG